MNNKLKRYYQKLFEEFGDDPRSVQHVSFKEQCVRFEILTAEIDCEESLIDLGCGLADMVSYLTSIHYKGKYLGIDFVPEFIDYASIKYADISFANFKVLDLLKESLPKEYDYIVMSGIFNNRLESDSNNKFLLETIIKAFEACQRGVFFNGLSTFVDFKEPHLYYADPLLLFNFIKTNITPFVCLKHDYVIRDGGFPYEFTIKMYKEAQL